LSGEEKKKSALSEGADGCTQKETKNAPNQGAVLKSSLKGDVFGSAA